MTYFAATLRGISLNCQTDNCYTMCRTHDIALYSKMEKNPLENVMLLYDDALIPLKSGQEEGCKVECRVCSFPFVENGSAQEKA